MTFLEFLSILRRRWYYLAVGLVAGVVGGFLTAPGSSSSPDQYTATHTLLADAGSTARASLNLPQTALLADTGPVPVRVAGRLRAEGLPPASSVHGVADLDIGSLEVTAIASSATAAERAADLTATEIVAGITQAEVDVYDAQLAALRKQRTQDQRRLAALDAQLATLAPEDPLRPSIGQERSQIDASLLDLSTQVQTMVSDGPPTPPLKTLEAAAGRPTTGYELPASPAARGAILGGLGLLLGMIGALAADRLDTRVRGKEDAERAFDLPVIAEVPPMAASGGGKGRELVVATRPASPFVEAFRALRTVILFAAADVADRAEVSANGALIGAPAVNGSAPHRSQVVLVTSPSAGEGKTTTAAHLAAVLAEAGRRTLVISADFRRPRIHEYFGVSREPGLSDVLASGTGRVRLSDLHLTTSFDGVHLMPSGGPVDNPAQLLAESADLIGAARQLFDYIVIDTPPLLVANDATELAAVADIILMVAKADRTSRSSSRRATEVLRRVDAPILGVVISAAHDTPTAYGYYRYRYYSDTDQGTGGRKRLSRRRRREMAGVGATTGSPAADDRTTGG